MKKILLFSTVLIALASCKKDYTCTCKTTDSTGTIEPITGSYVINATKAGAQDSCNSGNKSENNFTTVCNLN